MTFLVNLLARVVMAVAWAGAVLITVLAFTGWSAAGDLTPAGLTEAARQPLFGRRSSEVTYETPEIAVIGAEALTLIAFPWQEELRGWRVEFKTGGGNIAGYTWSREDRMEIFVRDGDDAAALARILAHELGHAVDVTRNSPEERTAWLAARGTPDAPWWPGNGAADFATGAGDFAEAFSVLEVGARDYRGELAPPPTPEQLDLLIGFAYD